jgi:hypothetical protein
MPIGFARHWMESTTSPTKLDTKMNAQQNVVNAWLNLMDYVFRECFLGGIIDNSCLPLRPPEGSIIAVHDGGQLHRSSPRSGPALRRRWIRNMKSFDVHLPTMDLPQDLPHDNLTE